MIQSHVKGIDHIALELPDLSEGVHFFQQILGFKVKRSLEFEGVKVVMLDAGRIELEMWQTLPEAGPHFTSPKYGVHHIAVQVRDLNAVMDYLQESGVQAVRELYSSTDGIREAIVAGPGDVRIQFIEQDLPRLIWRSIRGDFKEG